MLSVIGMQEPVIAYFLKALGQNMLEEPSDEFFGRKRPVFPALRCPVLHLKCHLAVVELFDALVGDGYSTDIGSQIFQCLWSGSDRFTINRPFFLPDPTGHFLVTTGFFEHGP